MTGLIKHLGKKIKSKEDALLITLVSGILLLSLGIGLIKAFPPVGSDLIIIGSSLVYLSVIALVFVIK